ncbi:uncharacterized protein H6S33_000530 [Morchella sextelata]|uniref:uncharacterized protein n=1 Tax=Morchella sextelata TaxID=1174677 RepID=UPI001D053522|nr:uncharacterized protein H6S33_000530 [Morchella sextelata]KAH0614894.1 hypothetical protein H6S33_000530 [Morchella sextelata]
MTTVPVATAAIFSVCDFVPLEAMRVMRAVDCFRLELKLSNRSLYSTPIRPPLVLFGLPEDRKEGRAAREGGREGGWEGGRAYRVIDDVLVAGVVVDVYCDVAQGGYFGG